MERVLLRTALLVISFIFCNGDGKYKGKPEEDSFELAKSEPIHVINSEQYNDQIHYLSNSWMLGICIFIGIVILFNISLICHLKCSKSKHLGNKSVNDAEMEQLAVKE